MGLGGYIGHVFGFLYFGDLLWFSFRTRASSQRRIRMAVDGRNFTALHTKIFPFRVLSHDI